jgi:hypothetical protein
MSTSSSSHSNSPQHEEATIVGLNESEASGECVGAGEGVGTGEGETVGEGSGLGVSTGDGDGDGSGVAVSMGTMVGSTVGSAGSDLAHDTVIAATATTSSMLNRLIEPTTLGHNRSESGSETVLGVDLRYVAIDQDYRNRLRTRYQAHSSQQLAAASQHR